MGRWNNKEKSNPVTSILFSWRYFEYSAGICVAYFEHWNTKQSFPRSRSLEVGQKLKQKRSMGEFEGILGYF